MSSECSLFIVLQSEPSSLLISTLYLLLRNQTLERIAKATKESPYIAEHLSQYQTTLKSTRLSVIPEDRSSASLSLVTRRPCSVVTMCAMSSGSLLLVTSMRVVMFSLVSIFRERVLVL